MVTGKNLLILTEAGDGIGFGHYSRCDALRSYFLEQGVQADIVLNLKGSETGQYLQVKIVDWSGQLEGINETRIYSHVLVDSYLTPLATFETLKKRFAKVIALDDYQRVDHGPDLIINPNIFGEKLSYSGTAVGGASYIILRKPFRNESRKLQVKQNVSKILVTVGGSDLRELLPGIIVAIKNAGLPATVAVVAGNDQYCAVLKARFAAMSSIVFFGFLRDDEMKDLMLDCDLAISACGQTLHELAWLGLPTIGICVGEDQVLNMREYVLRGFLKDELYWDSADLHSRLVQWVDRFSLQTERQITSELASGILSNRGVDNIYHEIFR